MNNDERRRTADRIFNIFLGIAELKTRGGDGGRAQEVEQTKLIDDMTEASRVDRGATTQFPREVAAARKIFRRSEVDTDDRKYILDLIHEWNHEHEAEYDPETLLDR